MRNRSALVVLVTFAAGVLLWSCGGSGGSTQCGNAAVDLGEECDDANRMDGDGCDSSCRIECGNGTVDQGEECDDSNQTDGDGCSAECKLECGDGVLDPGEQCDDGNQTDEDACRNDCTTAVDRCAAFIELEQSTPPEITCTNLDQRITTLKNGSLCFAEVVQVTFRTDNVREVGNVNCGDSTTATQPSAEPLVLPNSNATIFRSSPNKDCSVFEPPPRECRESDDAACTWNRTASADIRLRATNDASAAFVEATITAPTRAERSIGLCYVVDE